MAPRRIRGVMRCGTQAGAFPRRLVIRAASLHARPFAYSRAHGIARLEEISSTAL